LADHGAVAQSAHNDTRHLRVLRVGDHTDDLPGLRTIDAAADPPPVPAPNPAPLAVIFALARHFANDTADDAARAPSAT
jgi:hypothetical protein